MSHSTLIAVTPTRSNAKPKQSNPKKKTSTLSDLVVIDSSGSHALLICGEFGISLNTTSKTLKIVASSRRKDWSKVDTRAGSTLKFVVHVPKKLECEVYHVSNGNRTRLVTESDDLKRTFQVTVAGTPDERIEFVQSGGETPNGRFPFHLPLPKPDAAVIANAPSHMHLMHQHQLHQNLQQYQQQTQHPHLEYQQQQAQPSFQHDVDSSHYENADIRRNDNVDTPSAVQFEEVCDIPALVAAMQEYIRRAPPQDEARSLLQSAVNIFITQDLTQAPKTNRFSSDNSDSSSISVPADLSANLAGFSSSSHSVHGPDVSSSSSCSPIFGSTDLLSESSSFSMDQPIHLLDSSSGEMYAESPSTITELTLEHQLQQLQQQPALNDLEQEPATQQQSHSGSDNSESALSTSSFDAYPGLPREEGGLTCYVNSIVQLIVHTPQLRNFAMHHNRNPRATHLSILIQTLEQLRWSVTSGIFLPQSLVNLVKKLVVESGMQDASEYMQNILNLDQVESPTLIDVSETFFCRCGQVKKLERSLQMLVLQGHNQSDITAAINSSLTESGQYRGCGDSSCTSDENDIDLITLRTPTRLPEVLMLHVSPNANVLVKDDIDLHVEGRLKTFSVKGGIIHHGDHYTAIINCDDGQWREFNDDHVRLTSKDDALRRMGRRATLLVYIANHSE